MEKVPELTSERLRDLYVYCARTGNFYPRRRRQAVKLGEPAGTIRRGYVYIWIDGRAHAAHRLAWLYMTDEWPVGTIDHIDGNPRNNLWSNLRDVSVRYNGQNSMRVRKNNTSGYPGVVRAGKRWGVILRVNGAKRRFGTYENPADAYIEYLRLKALYQPGFVSPVSAAA